MEASNIVEAYIVIASYLSTVSNIVVWNAVVDKNQNFVLYIAI